MKADNGSVAFGPIATALQSELHLPEDLRDRNTPDGFVVRQEIIVW